MDLTRQLKTRMAFLILAVTAPMCANADARVEMIAGEGHPLCEAYLQAAKKWEYGTPACLGDQPIASKEVSRILGHIKKTEFSHQEDDPSHPMLANVWQFVRRTDVNEANYFYVDQLSGWIGTTEQREAAEQGIRNLSAKYFTDFSVRTMELDMDNDGRQDRLMVYPHCVQGSVTNTSTFSSPVFLTDTDEVDVERTHAYLRSPIRRNTSGGIRRRLDGSVVATADIFANSAYGLLEFRGRTYFDFWWDATPDAVPDPKDVNVIRVYLPQGGRSRAICAYRFDRASSGKN
jgi:hypothetical protein